jgi:prepilin-type N-terminal cleavage/methylation domain-containing protein
MPSPRRHAFTLVELLVAIGIIVVLVALTIGVGATMANAGKKRATEAALQTLDQMLDAYIQAKGDNPPGLVGVERVRLPDDAVALITPQSPNGYYPLFDGYSKDDEQPVNSIGLFLYEARNASSVQDILSGLDPKFVRSYKPAGTLQPELTTVFDAWGNPIRMVHPRFDDRITDSDRTPGDPGQPVDLTVPNNGFLLGIETQPSVRDNIVLAEVRRNALTGDDYTASPDLIGDSDGGICPSTRPYFYSAGPDGDPSTTEDNVYSATPRFRTPS